MFGKKNTAHMSTYDLSFHTRLKLGVLYPVKVKQ